MTSKEALYKILDKYETYHNIECCEEYFDLIEKDLERLEKLEEDVDDLLDDKLELVIKNKQQDILIGKFIEENKKLKKVIEILKNKWIDVGMVIHLIQCDNDTPEYYNEGLKKQYRLTQEEYDLLKEYL